MNPQPVRGPVLLAHHTPDVYGSDRQLLESVSALVEEGDDVIVSVPHDGPLALLLRQRGAEVVFVPMPVLRRSFLSPTGLLRLLLASATTLLPAVRLLRRRRVSALYVNTLTIPGWIVAGRLARVPTLCHVHEAQTEGPRLLRAALVAPLLLAHRVVSNSEASLAAIQSALPRAARHATVIYNGIVGPPSPPPEAPSGSPLSLALVGRLSPRKGTDVALDAAADLVRRGHDAHLHLAGDVFEGYEWFEEQLRARAGLPDLAGRVHFHGYVNPTWPLLADADIVLIPSRSEPFGNTAVEAALARRPVVASSVEGLPEIVVHGLTGLLVPPGDPTALADAVVTLAEHPETARTMADEARARGLELFAPARYACAVRTEVEKLRR